MCFTIRHISALPHFCKLAACHHQLCSANFCLQVSCLHFLFLPPLPLNNPRPQLLSLPPLASCSPTSPISVTRKFSAVPLSSNMKRFGLCAMPLAPASSPHCRTSSSLARPVSGALAFSMPAI